MSAGRLDDLHHLGACAVGGRRVARPERHAAHVHVFLAEIFSALLDERACPRLNLFSLQIGGDVARVLRRDLRPESREIGLAVGVRGAGADRFGLPSGVRGSPASADSAIEQRLARSTRQR